MIGLLVFFSYAIVLNTVVPISLYVSVEVSRNSTAGRYRPRANSFHNCISGHSFRAVVSHQLGREDVPRKDADASQSQDNDSE